MSEPAVAVVEVDLAAQDRLHDAVYELAQSKLAEFRRRRSLRTAIEERWLTDLRLYHEVYDDPVVKALKEDPERSKVFMGETRSKTDALMARLLDVLFPTDDRNWSMRATSAPELIADAEAVAAERAQALREMSAGPGPGPDAEAQNQRLTKIEAEGGQIEARRREAHRRAEAMQAEIDDQLKAGKYEANCREVIKDACKVGTGIIRCPVLQDPRGKGARWHRDPETDKWIPGQSAPRPSAQRVDYWNFFPSPEARRIEDSDENHVVHPMTPSQLRKFAKTLEPWGQEAVRRLLQRKATTAAPSWQSQLQLLNEESVTVSPNIYEVVEIVGPLDADELQILARAFADDEFVEGLDPLSQELAVIYVCENEVLKFALDPIGVGQPFGTFSPVESEGSIWGVGVPYMMRDPQAVISACWRATMDNANIASGAQIFIEDRVEPEDGDYKIRPNKVWRRNGSNFGQTGRAAMEVMEIPMRQQELASIIQMAREQAERATGIRPIDEGAGEAPPSIPQQTATGVAVMATASNVMIRCYVRNFDDEITVPVISRMFDWNMAHSPKEHIKGDLEIEARGASVLLVRELQARNLLTLALQFGGHPKFGDLIRDRAILKMVFKAHMIPHDEVLLSELEVDGILSVAEVERERIAAEQEDRDAERQVKVAIAELEASTRLRVATLQHETAMMQLAESLNMKADDLATKIGITRERIAHDDRKMAMDERKVAADIALAQEQGPSGGVA